MPCHNRADWIAAVRASAGKEDWDLHRDDAARQYPACLAVSDTLHVPSAVATQINYRDALRCLSDTRSLALS